MTKVYTSGVFDILHRGHFWLLTCAKALGDRLVVGIQADEAVYAIPGKQRPIHSTQERVAQMEALPFVDEVIVYHSGTTPEALAQVQPHVMVQGHDYLGMDRSKVVAYVEAHGIQLVLMPKIEGLSSSDIKRRVLQTAANAAAPQDLAR